MSFTVVFTATARRDLHGIPPRVVPAIIEFVYGDLSANPYRVGKPLKRELAGTFSARRGPYRILYDINDSQDEGAPDDGTADDKTQGSVLILQVDHRADVYRPH